MHPGVSSEAHRAAEDRRAGQIEREGVRDDIEAAFGSRFQVSRQHSGCGGFGGAELSGRFWQVRTRRVREVPGPFEGLASSKRRTNSVLDSSAVTSPKQKQPKPPASPIALGALSGLQKYLRSPQARENAKRARDRHIADAIPPVLDGQHPEQKDDEPTNQ